MACVRKRRDKWVLDFRDLQGKRHWESYRTRKEADAALAARVKELGERTYIPPSDEKTFSDLCKAFTKAHKHDVKENSWSDYETNMRLHLVPYFGRCKLRDIVHLHVEDFRAERLDQGLGKPTVTKCITLLVSLFKYAVKHRWMHINPAQGLKKLKVDELEDEMERVILSPVEFQRLLDSIVPKYQLIVKMAGLTGLRQGELIGLPWKHVDFDKRKVLVRQQHTAGRFSTLKTKKSRRDVPLSTGLANELREHWLASKWKGPEDLVFANSMGKPLGLKLLFKPWKDALRKAKLEDRKFHSLRHSYASALIRKEVNMKVVSTLCGHSSITITMDRYSHLLPDETDGIGELLEQEMLGSKKAVW
jgi:integrase